MIIKELLFKSSKYNIFYIISNFAKIYSKIFISKINQKKIVLINISEIHYFEHINHYVEILNTFPSLDIFIITREIYLKNKDISSLNKFVFPVRFVKYTFFLDLFISPCIESLKPKGCYSIHVFHNQPIKFLSYPEKNLKNFDEHFLWGSFMRSWMQDMIKNKSLKTKLTNIGNPRIDNDHKKFQNNKNNKNDKNKKLFTIGYAPTWNQGLSLETIGLEIIRAISSIKNSKSLIRLHPCSRIIETKNNNLSNGGNWIKKIEDTGLKKIKFSHNISTIEYLSKLDLLITDLSSISFEAFLLDIPVIFFHTENFWINYETSIYNEYLLEDKSIIFAENNYMNGGRTGGITVKKIGDLIKNIEQIKNDNDQTKNKRRDLAGNLLYNKGKSSKVIKKRLDFLLSKNKSI